jgi:hypothetical protein
MTCYRGSDCAARCLTSVGDADDPPSYKAMLLCQAQSLTAADYYCSATAADIWRPSPTADGASPNVMGSIACKVEICASQCVETTYTDEAVYNSCGSQSLCP